MNLYSLLDAASFSPRSLRSPSAWIGHLPFAAWVIREMSPKVFVELGTHTGTSYFSFCQAVAELGLPTKCFAVDTWQGDEQAGHYGEEIFEQVNAYHQEHYADFSRLLRMKFDDAVSYFTDQSIELLHIDGLHTYEAVSHDFATWLPKLAPGAVVIIHDTNVRGGDFGVWKLWEELQARYPNNIEFLHSHGLGVLQLDNAPDEKKLPWLDERSPDRQRLRSYFAQLGSRQQERDDLNSLKTQVIEYDKQVVALEQTLHKREGEIADLKQTLRDREREIARLNEQVTDRQCQVAMVSSFLRPLRGLVRFGRQIALGILHLLKTYRLRRDIRLVAKNGGFDISYYLCSYPDVRTAKCDPIRHYCEFGWNEGRNPSPQFDTNYYLDTNPDVVAAGINPYVHFIKYGRSEHRLPLPNENSQTTAENRNAIANQKQTLLSRGKDIPEFKWSMTGIEGLVSRTAVIPSRATVSMHGMVSKVFEYMKIESSLASPKPSKTLWKLHWWLSITRQAFAVLLIHGRRELRRPANGDIRPTQKFSNDYQEWIRRYDTLTTEKRTEIERRIRELSARPLISVLMPVFNPPPQFLDEAIQSVRRQIYSHWELCIADDASTDPAVQQIIERHRKEEHRIKVVYRQENGHISRASNSALELAKGEFVALFDHDDILPEHALFWIVDAINRHPGAGLFYSDEDKIDKSGKRYDPYFKCDFNYELLLAQNMISHLGVYRADLVRELDGFRTGYEGSQDWDLALRVIERLTPDQIVHIPRVLYHWRAITGSTALATEEKDYASEAGRNALKEHLLRCQIEAEVLPAPEAPAYTRIRFALSNPPPLVSILIPTRDRADLLKLCVTSIIEHSSYSNYEIIIIDNGSVEAATLHLFEDLPKDRVRILRNDAPFNFSALNNHGACMANGELLCLMNNDIEILTRDWLQEMTSFAMLPEVGAVGARLWYPDGRLQHGGVILGLGGVAGHCHNHFPRGVPGYFGRMVLHQNFSAVTAACLVIRKAVFEAVGGLDESLTVAFNDVDFCLRVIEAGYRNVWTPYAEMKHHESASRGYENTLDKQKRFVREVHFMQRRWGNKLLKDPAYNPNLSLDRENFSLAWPPRVDLLAPSGPLSRQLF